MTIITDNANESTRAARVIEARNAATERKAQPHETPLVPSEDEDGERFDFADQ